MRLHGGIEVYKPWVSYNTAQNWVQCVSVPATGAVFVGMDVGSDLPTCGIPVPNPICSNLEI